MGSANLAAFHHDPRGYANRPARALRDVEFLDFGDRVLNIYLGIFFFEGRAIHGPGEESRRPGRRVVRHLGVGGMLCLGHARTVGGHQCR